MKSKILLILLPLLSFLGFLDATYLTITHYQNTALNCSIFAGCEKVLTSDFSKVGEIPVALLGSFFFSTVLFLSILFLQTHQKKILQSIVALSVLGSLASLGFFLIQLLVIKAFCPYCIFSEIISIFLLTISLVLLRLNSSIKHD